MKEGRLERIAEQYSSQITQYNCLMWTELIRKCTSLSRSYERIKNPAKAHEMINLTLDSSKLAPLSDLLDDWVYIDQILTSEDKEHLLGLSKELVESEFQERDAIDVIKKYARKDNEKQLTDKIESMLFCYDSESFFNNLVGYYTNFETPQRVEMLQHLENIQSNQLLLTFLNHFLHTPSAKGLNLGHDLLTKLQVLDMFAKEGLSEADTLKHGLTIKSEDENYMNRLRRAVIFNKDCVADALDCASIETPGEKIMRKIGSGGSGTTYQVDSVGLGVDLALKIVKEQFFNPQEARILAKLDHPNIVRVYYAGDNFVKKNDKYVPAILMEYVNGPSLKEYIKESPARLSKARAIDYSNQLFSAVEHLREKGVFHRDFNPANIKVEFHPNTQGVLKVYDFGFGESCLDAKPQGNRRYGGESDLFSWGLITYELATGKHLITDRQPEDSSNSFAEKIQKLKGTARDDVGNLTEEYKQKIQETVPEELQKPIMLALENTADVENTVRFAKIKEIYVNLPAA